MFQGLRRPSVELVRDRGDAELAPITLPDPEVLRTADGARLISLLRPGEAGGQGIVQFVSARPREGTSAIARDAALIAAGGLGLRVLLLDLAAPGTAHATWLRNRMGDDAMGDWLDVRSGRAADALGGVAPDLRLMQAGSPRLHVSERGAAGPAGGAEVPQIVAAQLLPAFPALREAFDLVVIDSPALERSYDSVLLAPHLDTSILVVEAEATRATVAQNLRDRILAVGGGVAGVVLNKRRFHIPKAIYDWL